jgi:hypothetical protein
LTAEPLFARLWYGEALNFGKVSEWNRQLDAPRRLRISSISINADALLNARGVELLDQLASEQRSADVLPLWVDEYARRVRSFQTASIARSLDGEWSLYGDALRTVRLSAAAMAPHISEDVTGYADRNGERYIHFARNHAILKPAQDKERSDKERFVPSLRMIRAGAPLQSWHLNSDGSATFFFEPRGDVAVEVPSSCTLSVDGTLLPPRPHGSHSMFVAPAHAASGEFHLEC